MNLYEESNMWLYQPIVVELDDSSYYDEESGTSCTSLSSFYSNQTTAINNSCSNILLGPGNVSIVVRSDIPPPPPCSPIAAANWRREEGGRSNKRGSATSLATAATAVSFEEDHQSTAVRYQNTSVKHKKKKHRDHHRRRKEQQHHHEHYNDYYDYYLQHWKSCYKHEFHFESQRSRPLSSSSRSNRKRDQVDRPEQVEENQRQVEEHISVAEEGTSETNRMMNFHDVYVLTRQIDKGAFSTVWEAIHRTSGHRYAAKLIDRRTLSPSDDKSIYREVATLRHLHNLPPFREDDDYYHDYGSGSSASVCSSSSKSTTRHYATSNLGIIHLVDFYVEPTHFFLVTDYVGGGDLFSRVLEKRFYDEETARELARGFFQSLYYLHSRNVVHRDIKPENLLLCSREDDVTLKIADFGFATRLKRADRGSLSGKRRGSMSSSAGKEKEEEDYKVRDKCGTPSYVAPEVLRGIPYDTQADMWSAGVVMYFLMGGYPPFVDRKSRKGLFRKIIRGEYEFHDTDWSEVSDEAKNFIRRLLTVCPDSRMTAEECLSHPWIRGGGGDGKAKVVSSLGTTKSSSSNDTKMTSISSATAMSSTTSTITTSHLHISNSSHHKFDHGHPTKTQVSNRVRNARKKLSKVFSSMKNSGNNDKAATVISSSSQSSRCNGNAQTPRHRLGTGCSVTVASTLCDESSLEPPFDIPAKAAARLGAPRRRTGTI
uniref:Protein kinase domain-containing protein n=1 Tax=Ditylum brightwellii TaxID=49249 RepID=A0A7S2EVE3_9STRA|mmetsp:Transcript_8308/g.12410  ORF Transcript_8308/g.12410 Transcript_8308/m.12410 type:complete len:712 (+) Transcript_8308:111-2246(+)